MSGPARADDAAALWTSCMRRGDFEGAWGLNDLLRQTGMVPRDAATPRHLRCIWDGSPIEDRRVLVRCYHGLGDTLQFIRYARLVRRLARDLTVWAQPKLIPLLGTVAGIDRLVPLHDGEIEGSFDVDLEIMELPYLFRTTLTTIPADVPYVTADPEPLERERPSVGLVWRAGEWAAQRSIPFRRLEPLLALPATWYVLQGQPGLSERPPGSTTVAVVLGGTRAVTTSSSPSMRQADSAMPYGVRCRASAQVSPPPGTGAMRSRR